MDYSVIITAKDEPKTVGRLVGQIEAQMPQISQDFEILLVCPDKRTKESAISQDRLQVVTWLKDRGEGKPSALNLAFSKAKGNILILTDGDVALGKGALKKLTSSFCLSSRPKRRPRPQRIRASVSGGDLSFSKRDSSTRPRHQVGTVARNDRELGLVTGRPVPVNKRDNLFGFWAHFLTTAADQQRRRRSQNDQYLDASGYLLAVKKELVSSMPKNILVDDAWLSRKVWKQGYKIGYAPEAKVRVKFPTNLSDWITQKKRTTSGYVQLSSVGNADSACCEAGLRSLQSMRGFFQEAKGLRLALTYPKNLKEYFWILLLIVVRVYVWLVVFWQRKVLKKPYAGNWKRIESTK